MATLRVGDLGDYIREQRRSAQISLRQLANLAGVSNPYLSQIERGLRKPSADILQQIARALRVSAEALYVRAGILEDVPVDRTVVQAVLGDSRLSERQKSVLLQIYESFCTENAEGQRASGESEPEAEAVPVPEPVPDAQRLAPAPDLVVAPESEPDTATQESAPPPRRRASTRKVAEAAAAANGKARTGTKARAATKVSATKARATPKAGAAPAAASRRRSTKQAD